MSERQAVGSMSEWADMFRKFFRQIKRGVRTKEHFQGFLDGKNPFEKTVAKVKDWLQPIIDLERKCHQDFFQRVFSLVEFTRTLKKYGAEQVEAWKKLGLEPHFLPAVSMMSGDDYPGWKTKPGEWFYRQLVQGNIFQMICGKPRKLTTINLGGITVLIDTRLKPDYGDEYRNDWLGPIIKQLRKDGKIQDFNSRSSRFNVSAVETELIKEAAKIFGLDPEQLRLEREIEANVIPQLYPYMPRKDDGKTKTWEWREEFFEGRGIRLSGGGSGGGGLAGVGYGSASDRWGGGAFRFLVVL